MAILAEMKKELNILEKKELQLVRDVRFLEMLNLELNHILFQ